MAELYCLPPSVIPEVWREVDRLLRPAMQRTGEMPMRDLLGALLNGRFLLWVAVGERLEAVAVTEVAETTVGKVCVVVACGGSKLKRWIGLLNGIEQYAQAEGCERMRIYGRKGWVRVLPAYKAKRVILEKELG